MATPAWQRGGRPAFSLPSLLICLQLSDLALQDLATVEKGRGAFLERFQAATKGPDAVEHSPPLAPLADFKSQT